MTTPRKKIPQSTWNEIQTLYASGTALRDIARIMEIPAGTLLSRANREKWTLNAASAKLRERPELARELLIPESKTVTPSQVAAMTMKERADKYTELMASLTGERNLNHLETLSPEELLERADRVEKLDRVARRSFGLDKETINQPVINLQMLSMGLPDFLPTKP